MLNKISYLFEKKVFNKFIYIVFFSLLIPILEVISIASIIPVVKIITSDSFAVDYPIIYDYIFLISNFLFNQSSHFNLIFTVFILYFIIYFIRTLIVFFLQFKINDFVFSRERDLKKRFSIDFFKMKYLDKIKFTSSHYYSVFTTQIEFLAGTIRAFINIIVDSITLLFISIFLIFYQFNETIKILIIFGIIIFLFLYLLNKVIKKLSKERNEKIENIYRLFSIIVNNFEDLIIFNKSKIFLNYLNLNLNKYKNIYSLRAAISLLPKHILELFGLAIFFYFILTGFKMNNSTLETFGTMGVYFFIILKLLPVVNRIINSAQDLKFSKFALDQVCSFKEYLDNKIELNIEEKNIEKFENIEFKDKFELKKCSFSYQNKIILNEADLTVNKGEFITIFGQSGIGKSTIIKILAGLINYENGDLIVDGKVTKLSSLRWKRLISYVPQDIAIYSGTISQNISLEENLDKIDESKLKNSIIKANLNDFVTSKKEGLNYKLDDKGKNISGGQIQRLGIARALYHNPKILLLDEFSSSLDDKTENEILQTLQKLKNELTIVAISHKKSITIYSDAVYIVENNKIKISQKK